MAPRPSPKFDHTDEELEGLTDEERAGLMEEVDESMDLDGKPIAEAKAEDDTDPEPEPPAKAQEPAADQEKPAEPADPAAKDAADAEQDPEYEADPEPAAPPAPAAAQLPADAQDRAVRSRQLQRGLLLPPIKFQMSPEAQQQYDELEAQIEATANKCDDGEIREDEKRKITRDLERQQRQIAHEDAQKQTAQELRMTAWRQFTVPDFLDEHPEYKPGTLLYKMLDEQVRTLQATTTGDNLDPQILEDAHAAVQQQLIDGGLMAPKPKVTIDLKANPRQQTPPTLAHLPAAEPTALDEGSRFAWLDRLADKSYEKYEEALAKLSDADRDAYLASG